jgi:hypothetical protein
MPRPPPDSGQPLTFQRAAPTLEHRSVARPAAAKATVWTHAVSAHGGFPAVPRQRSLLAMMVAEREEIFRSLATARP